MIEVRYRKRIMQQYDSDYVNDDLILAYKYVELVTGMEPAEARAFGWRIIGVYNCCISCGKPAPPVRIPVGT